MLLAEAPRPALPVILDGIALDVPQPDRHLRALRYVVRHRYPELPARPGIDACAASFSDDGPSFDASRLSHLLGYHDEQLLGMIDREWLAGSDEAEIVTSYLERRSFLPDGGSVFIWGAGTCGLGDVVAAREGVASVTCADLSWLALYFGRELIAGRVEALPPLLRRDRVTYRRSGSSLRAVSAPARFRRARCRRPDRIRYVVRDAFDRRPSAEAEVVIVPFVLDTLTGARVETMLIRICQQVAAGQDLLLLVTCLAGSTPAVSRDPAEVLRVLGGCGFTVQCLDLKALPYTLAPLGFAPHRTTWTTLIVRARKTGDAPAITVVNNRPAADGGAARRLLDACRTGEDYSVALDRLRAVCGATAAETAFGQLAASGVVDLRAC